MAHFDGGTDLLITLLSILGLYLVLVAVLLIQDMLGRKDGRTMASDPHFPQGGAFGSRKAFGPNADLLDAPPARQSLPKASS